MNLKTDLRSRVTFQLGKMTPNIQNIFCTIHICHKVGSYVTIWGMGYNFYKFINEIGVVWDWNIYMCNTHDGEIQAAKLSDKISKVQKRWKLMKTLDMRIILKCSKQVFNTSWVFEQLGSYNVKWVIDFSSASLVRKSDNSNAELKHNKSC